MTIVELLAVIAVIAVVTAFSAPALNQVASTYQRESSLNELQQTLDQARALALAEGCRYRVVFCTDLSAPEDLYHRSYATFRDEESGVPLQVTPWKTLAKGFVFRDLSDSLVGDKGKMESIHFAPLNRPLTLPYVQFDDLGRVVEPTNPNACRLEVWQGHFTNGTFMEEGDHGANVLSLSRMTGRTKQERTTKYERTK